MTSIVQTYTARLIELAAEANDAALIVTSTARAAACSTTPSPNSQSDRSNRPSRKPSGTTAFNDPSTRLAFAWTSTSTRPTRSQSLRRGVGVMRGLEGSAWVPSMSAGESGLASCAVIRLATVQRLQP